MMRIEEIEARVRLILIWHPDPVPRYRLLPDVPRLPRRSRELREAKSRFAESPWGKELSAEQNASE